MECWVCGRWFDFDDYLTESLHTGTIEVVEPDKDTSVDQ
jgi:hypothetical protein